MSIKEPENGEPGVRYICKADRQLGIFLDLNASCIVDEGGKKAYFLPYWFEEAEGDRFELHHLDSLPEWIKNFLHDTRGTDPLKEKSDLMEQLKDFLDYLLQAGYCDSDVYDEPPTAIDRYMKTK